MSFKKANQQLQKYVGNFGNTDRTYKILRAVQESSNLNNKIMVKDNGDIQNGAGKLRELKVTYWPLICSGVEGSGTESFCDPGLVLQPRQINFALTRKFASVPFQINKDDLRDIDGNVTFSDVAMNIVNSVLPEVRRQYAIDVLTLITANLGCQLDGSETKRVTMSDSTNGAINVMGKREIERVFENGGFMPPFIVGDDDVDNWIKGTSIGAANSLGQNIAQLGKENMYYEPLVDTVLGDTENGGHIIAWDPQVFKWVSFSRNAGIFSTDLKNLKDFDKLFQSGGTNYMYGTLLDPVTGILWDLNARFDECLNDGEGAWVFQFKLLWDIFFNPDVACNNAECVNGLFHFRTCAPVMAPCPVGDEIPAAPAAATFELDASDEGIVFPFYLGTLNVAGFATTPDINIVNIAALEAALEANSQMQFTVAGDKLQYAGFTGHDGIAIALNGTAHTFTEA